jgi:hypothetical protein
LWWLGTNFAASDAPTPTRNRNCSLVVESLARGDAANINGEARKTRLFLEALTGRKV